MVYFLLYQRFNCPLVAYFYIMKGTCPTNVLAAHDLSVRPAYNSINVVETRKIQAHFITGKSDMTLYFDSLTNFVPNIETSNHSWW